MNFKYWWRTFTKPYQMKKLVKKGWDDDYIDLFSPEQISLIKLRYHFTRDYTDLLNKLDAIKKHKSYKMKKYDENKKRVTPYIPTVDYDEVLKTIEKMKEDHIKFELDKYKK